MSALRVCLVEDSRLARLELRELLRQVPQVEILGEAASIGEAETLIATCQPDVLLLDIQLPDGSGFDLLERLPSVPEVIFTTAYSEHALAAFEANALDYLLKPVELERLVRALGRAGARARRPPVSAYKSRGDRIFVKDGERCHFLALQDIRLFEVEGNYTRLYCGPQKPLLLRSIAYLEERLDPALFFRCNRQQIANLDFVTAVEPLARDGLLVLLRSGEQIVVSRRQARQLKSLLEI